MKALILTLLFISSCLYAQDMSKNHQKYWYLRSKLRNDFMKVGLNQGESIPMTFRGKYATAANSAKTLMGGGDLISEIGIYLGVLATEYQLLALNNQSTDSVRRELYCALNAVNRLDYNAEALYGYSNSLNGFLIRDDIPGNFILKNYKHFNYYNQWSGDTINDIQMKTDHKGNLWKVPNTFLSDRGLHSIIPVAQWETSSVYYEKYQKNGTSKAMAMSQDHLISLLYGLRLITEYVDAGANFQNQPFLYGDGAYSSIKEEAQVISDRIVKYLKNNNWRIKEPDGTNVSDHDGGNVLIYSYAIAQIAGKINNPGTSVNNWPPFVPVPVMDQDYHNFQTTTLGFTGYQTAAKTPSMTFDLITQMAQLSSACQCLFDKIGGNIIQTITLVLDKIWKWLGVGFGWYTNVQIAILNYVVPISWINSTISESIANATTLSPNASKSDRRIKYQQDYALITNLLYQNKNVSNLTNPLLSIYNNVLSRTSDILNNAPCDGPRNFTEKVNNYTTIPSYDVYEWSSSSLIEHSNILGSDNIDSESNNYAWKLQSGEYNGLDYMLYHNLYYLYKQSIESESAESVDLRDRFVNYSLPLATGQGSQSNPLTIGAMENINTHGTVNSNASIHFKMGKQFAVLQGHEYAINNGAEVSIETHNYDCGSNNYMAASALKQSNTSPEGMYSPISSLEKLHETPYIPEPKIIDRSTGTCSRQKDPFENKKVINLNDKIMIYPIPCQGSFTVKIDTDSDNEKYSLSLYDMTGKLLSVYENLSTVQQEIHINEELASGAYVVKIVAYNTGKQYTEKLIVNKK